MKINVEVECSPEEARQFMGLPDVSKANDVYVDAVTKMMKDLGKDLGKGISSTDQLQEYARHLAPMGQMGLKMFQQLMENGAAMGGKKRTDD